MSNMVLTMAEQAASGSPDKWFVVGMGIGTVFVGLILLIILCKIIGFFCQLSGRKSSVSEQPKAVSNEIENRGEIIAAVATALAEELGTDVSAIRILSFKKI